MMLYDCDVYNDDGADNDAFMIMTAAPIDRSDHMRHMIPMHVSLRRVAPEHPNHGGPLGSHSRTVLSTTTYTHTHTRRRDGSHSHGIKLSARQCVLTTTIDVEEVEEVAARDDMLSRHR